MLDNLALESTRIPNLLYNGVDKDFVDKITDRCFDNTGTYTRLSLQTMILSLVWHNSY